MRMLVVAAAVAVLSVNSAAAQERGWLAIGLESARHAFSFSGSADAVNACGMSDCEVVETFTACLAVAYSSETASGRPVWTWTEAATDGDARQGAQEECEAAGGLRCAVENTYCLDGAGPATQQATPPATAEQENIFWQSIMNSENPAEFEAYLRRFPNGVFSELAQARMTALAASPGGRRPGASGAAASAPNRVSTDPVAQFRPDQICEGKPAGVACWKEILQQPGCHVWSAAPQPNTSVTWTGDCVGGLAEGTGTLTWSWDGNRQTEAGHLVGGKTNGHWVIRFTDGTIHEGSFVDAEESGHWVFRRADGTIAEGPFVNGQMHGSWMIRFADGTVEERLYSDGERVR